MAALWSQVVFIAANFSALLEGAAVTVKLSVAMLCLGFAVGVPIAVLEVYGPTVVRICLLTPIVTFFRGVPTLVLLFLASFGIPKLGVDLSAFAAAIVAIGLRSGIYQSQLLRGAIMSVAGVQMVAARAIGMSKWQGVRYIIVPQAFRLSLPSYTNEYAVVLKESSLAYAIGVTELMRQGRYIVARTFDNSLSIYITCAIIYFVLVFGVAKVLQRVEARFAIPGFEGSGPKRIARGERQ